MTEIIYSDNRDKELINNSINYLTWITYGKNNQNLIRGFIDIFNSKVSYIKVIPHGDSTEHIGGNTGAEGMCFAINEDDVTLGIEMHGYKNAPISHHKFIRHEGIHEICHAFADILPLIYDAAPREQNGITYRNQMGMISQRDTKTGKFVGQQYYGKMFNETMMDIFSTIGLASYDPSFRGEGITADAILKSNYKDWKNATTGYSMFTSITRLAIAAFSNNGKINYNDLIEQGYGIVDVNTKTESGEILKANDFLYGVMCNPMHVEEEFDKFMGEGTYRIFNEYLDRLFLMFQGKEKIPAEEVKRVMNFLPDFLNRKCRYNVTNGIYTQTEANDIIGNFNGIWNAMQQEYGAYFNADEINDIARRAHEER